MILEMIEVRQDGLINMEKIAVRGIAKKGDKYLLVQRSKNSSKSGYWQFPGGKSDNQHPIKALKREFKEETGLNISNIKKLKKVCNMKFCTIFYKVKPKGKIKLQKSELQNYGWFTKKQAKKLPLTYGGKEII